MTMKARPFILPLFAFVMLVVIWEVAVAALKIPPFLLPAPSAIVSAAMQLGGPLMARHFLATLSTVLLGFAISIVVGVPLGTALASSKTASEAFHPLLVFTHAIPVVAIAPIIVVVFGTGLTARLIVVTLISFFPIMVSTATGILNAPADLLELGRTAGASKWQTICTIKFPNAVPFIFNGLRIGVTGSVIGAVVAEFVSADAGLGYLVVRATTDFNIPLALASVTVLATMSVTLYQLVSTAQRIVFPWNPRQAG